MAEIAFDLESIDKSLTVVSMESDPLEWGRLLNIKGVLLRNRDEYVEADQCFVQAGRVDDPLLKCKVLINHAKLFFFKNNGTKAIELVNKVFEIEKQAKKAPLTIVAGYAHLLKGEILYSQKINQTALREFKVAEYYFEKAADLRGTGLANIEIARVHIKEKNLTATWNYLQKGENCLRRIGGEELLGAEICKGVALYYSGKEIEAMALLRDVYKEKAEYGRATNTIDEIIDVYLSIKDRALHYQMPLL